VHGPSTSLPGIHVRSAAARIAGSQFRHTRFDERVPLGQEGYCPHDITARETEDECTSPYRLIISLGAEEPRANADNHNNHEAD